jgi:hypothetical protein
VCVCVYFINIVVYRDVVPSQPATAAPHDYNGTPARRDNNNNDNNNSNRNENNRRAANPTRNSSNHNNPISTHIHLHQRPAALAQNLALAHREDTQPTSPHGCSPASALDLTHRWLSQSSARGEYSHIRSPHCTVAAIARANQPLRGEMENYEKNVGISVDPSEISDQFEILRWGDLQPLQNRQILATATQQVEKLLEQRKARVVARERLMAAEASAHASEASLPPHPPPPHRSHPQAAAQETLTALREAEARGRALDAALRAATRERVDAATAAERKDRLRADLAALSWASALDTHAATSRARLARAHDNQGLDEGE